MEVLSPSDHDLYIIRSRSVLRLHENEWSIVDIPEEIIPPR